MSDAITAKETIKHHDCQQEYSGKVSVLKITPVLFHKGKQGDPALKAEELSSASFEGSFLNNVDKFFSFTVPPPPQSKMQG